MLTPSAVSMIRAYGEEIDSLDSIDLMEITLLVEDEIGDDDQFQSAELDDFVRLFRAKYPAAYNAFLADTTPQCLAVLNRVESEK